MTDTIEELKAMQTDICSFIDEASQPELLRFIEKLLAISPECEKAIRLVIKCMVGAQPKIDNVPAGLATIRVKHKPRKKK